MTSLHTSATAVHVELARFRQNIGGAGKDPAVDQHVDAGLLICSDLGGEIRRPFLNRSRMPSLRPNSFTARS